ncbi:MAG: hypothetical protein GF393_12395 [Armatimonadia bacterium]|nr:hypothetical protein [Armatimonadia bacterium]
MRKLSAPHYAALAILGLALLAGRVGQRVIDLSDFPLEDVPTQLGPWETVHDERMTSKETLESRCIRRIYSRDDGVQIMVILQLTASRMGALRNWPVGRMGTGTNVDEAGTWEGGRPEGLPFDLVASEQWLRGNQVLQFSSIWFVSPREGTPSFRSAQIKGWRDRLLGRCMWGEMYFESVAGTSREQVIAATRDLASRIAPHLHEMTVQAARGGSREV